MLRRATAPGDEAGGELRLDADGDGLLEAFGAIDVPVSEGLETRLSLDTRQQDGCVTRVFDGEDLGAMDDTTVTASALRLTRPAIQYCPLPADMQRAAGLLYCSAIMRDKGL